MYNVYIFVYYIYIFIWDIRVYPIIIIILLIANAKWMGWMKDERYMYPIASYSKCNLLSSSYVVGSLTSISICIHKITEYDIMIVIEIEDPLFAYLERAIIYIINTIIYIRIRILLCSCVKIYIHIERKIYAIIRNDIQSDSCHLLQQKAFQWWIIIFFSSWSCCCSWRLTDNHHNLLLGLHVRSTHFICSYVYIRSLSLYLSGSSFHFCTCTPLMSWLLAELEG